LYKIANGFLSSGDAGKPQECLEPFKVLPRRMAAKRQGKMYKLFTDSTYVAVPREDEGVAGFVLSPKPAP